MKTKRKSARPSRRRLSHPPRTTGTLSRLAYGRAKEAGISVAPLLQAAGLSARDLKEADSRIGVRDQIVFVNSVADALGDDYLGFHLAQTAEPRELGLFYYVLASSATLIDALGRAARYSSIVNEGIRQRVIDGRQIGVSQHLVGVSRHVDRHQTEFTLAAAVRICRMITGRRLVPRRVKFVHTRERDAQKKMVAIFGDDIQFGAASDELTFDGRMRDLPVVDADPYLNRLLTQYCEEAIAYRNPKRVSFRSTVENAIVPALPHGMARADKIAAQLGYSRRTFERRLAAEGLTFSAILDGLRLDLVNRYLEEKELSISQIAWLVGYADIAALSHAYKKWTGKTPRDARSRIGQSRKATRRAGTAASRAKRS